MKNASDKKPRKLNYIIHNPNSVETTAKVLLEILISANANKVEKKIQEWAESCKETDKQEEAKEDSVGVI